MENKLIHGARITTAGGKCPKCGSILYHNNDAQPGEIFEWCAGMGMTHDGYPISCNYYVIFPERTRLTDKKIND